jgi:O-antigen ligase
MSDMLIHPEQRRQRLPDWRRRLTHIGTGPIRWTHYLTVIFVLLGSLYLGYLAGFYGSVASRPVLLFLVGVASLFILKYPFLGVVIVMATLPIVELIPRIPVFDTLASVVGGVTLLSYLLRTLVTREGEQRYRVHSSLIFAGMFILWVFATHPAAALLGVDRNWLLTFIQLAVVAWLASHLIVKPHEHHIMMVVFVVALVISSIDLLQEASRGTIINQFRPDGLVGSTNDAARHLVSGFLILIYFYQVFRVRYLRGILLGGSILFLVSLLYTLSRSGLALLVLAIGLIIIKGLVQRSASAGRLRQSIVALVLVVVTMLYIPPELFQQLEKRILPVVTPGQEFFDLRGVLWQIGLDVWVDNPIAGTGVGTFNEIAPQYAAARLHFNLPALNSHNAYISLLAETGTVGFLIYSAMLIFGIVALWRATRDPDPREAEIAWTWFMILVMLCVGGITKQETYDKNVWIVIGIAAGYGIRQASKKLPSPDRNLIMVPDEGQSR